MKDLIPLTLLAAVSIGPLLLHYAFGLPARTSILIPYALMLLAYAVLLVGELRAKQRKW